jgi:hypothetical protein
METATIVLTTPVPGVLPTQTYLVPASTLQPEGIGPNAGAAVTVSAFPILVASTAFEYPNVVLGTMVAAFGGELAPPPGATPPWGNSLRLTLQNFALAAPTDVQGAVPTTPNTTTVGSATTKDPIQTSSSVSETPSAGLGTGTVAGVAIGCLLAGALLFAVVFFWINRRRKNASADRKPASTTIVSDLKGDDAHLPHASSPAELHVPAQRPPCAELPAQRPPSELSDQRPPPVELPGQHVLLQLNV